MKTRMSPNSLEAFKLVDLSKRQTEVYNIIKSTGVITAKGIAFQMKLPINHVTGRINELMKLQLIRIEKVGKDVCGAKCNVNFYCVRKESDPLNVFELSWENKFKLLESHLTRNYPTLLFEYEALHCHKL